ncbi:hypothetical protein SprV_0100001600 [Sparganum proliferum]
MATSSSDEETARRKSTRQRRNPFDRRYWELGEPPMSPDERDSDQESVDTLPARRQQNDTACLEIWTGALEEGFEVDVEYIDFRKAFDTVTHQRLLHKLSSIGIRGDILNWIRAFLIGRKQRVRTGDDKSEWVNVTSGVPQGSVLEPLLFLLYVYDNLQELDCGKIIFADEVKLWQVIKSPYDQRVLQDNLHRLQAWSEKWLLDINVQKCAVLHLRPTNSHSNESLRTYHLNDIRLPAESSQKDLGV